MKTWNCILVIMCILVILVHVIRILLVLFKDNYLARRGYRNVKITRLYVITESLIGILIFIILSIRGLYELNKLTPSFDAILDKGFSIALILFLVNSLIFSKLTKKYKLSTK